MAYRRTLLAIVATLAVCALAVWLFTPVAHYSGSAELTVQVIHADGPIRSIHFRPFYHREDAEGGILCFLDGRPDGEWQGRDRFDGKPLKIEIYVLGRAAWYGSLSRHQDRYLAVVAQLKDGRRISKIVPTPDTRESCELLVVLP